jgi:hypothetical protein
MEDLHREIDDLRLDVQTLRAVIDAALERGVRGDDVMLRACANVLYDRRTRLEELEQALNHGPGPGAAAEA